MIKSAVKVEVIESEKDSGQKTEDWMVCLTTKDAINWKKDFNSCNTETETPDWYMMAKGEPQPIDITDKQYDYLIEKRRVWLSKLKRIV